MVKEEKKIRYITSSSSVASLLYEEISRIENIANEKSFFTIA